MDLRSMLNDDAGNASSPRRTPGRSTGSPHPLPSLATNVSNMSAVPLHSPGTQQQQQHQYQPTAIYQQQYPPVPPSASPHLAYHQRGLPASPYTPGTTLHSQAASTQRPPSHPSITSTPTSVHNQSPPAHRSSPDNTRPPSQHSGYAPFPTPNSQPPTPMYGHRPPQPQPQPTTQRQSSRELVGIPSGQPYPVDTVYSSSSGHRVQGVPDAYAARQSADTPSQSGHYNHQQVMDDLRRRSKSISVSPKTIFTSIPPSGRSSTTPHTPAADYVSSSAQAAHSQAAQGHVPQQLQQHGGVPLYSHSQTGKSHDLAMTHEPPLSRRETGNSIEQTKTEQQLDDSMKPPSSRSSSNHKDQINPDITHSSVRSPSETTAARSQGARLKEENNTPPLMRNPQPYATSRSDIMDQKNHIPEKWGMTPAELTSSNHLKRTYTPDDSVSDSKSGPPAVKKARYTEPPVWAQPSRKNTPLKKYSRERLQAVGLAVGESSSQQPQQPQQQPINGTSKQQPKTEPPPNPSQMQATPVFADDGPLGPWEPCFTSVIPYEEITRALSDFLYVNVVENRTLQTGVAGEVPSVNGQLEIEAKIGRIVDKKDGARVRLPVMTEALIPEDMGIGFESFMSEGQHKHYNDYLNGACQLSLQRVAASNRSDDAKNRIRMQYKHTREIDTFYPLPDEEVSNLPPSIKSMLALNPNHKPKLRVTRDQSTGKVLAKIIKVRVRDIHIYSPRTLFDWRVSVNVEMDWEGDENALAAAVGGPGAGMPARNKDRISYRHICCQIDLTQVKSAAGLVHELEVEIDSTAVREQGQLAVEGKPNQYEELIKSFADNVRILTRQGISA